NGQLSVASGSTLSLANQSIAFSGAAWGIDGTLSAGGASQVTFDGSQIQVITGSAGSTLFDNMVINNTAPGNNDLQLNMDVTSRAGVNFVEGIVQSSGSSTLTFGDNATVSYDGVLDAFPIGANPDENSFVVGPVVKVGDDDFIFPIGEGTRLARLGVSNLDDGGAVILTVTDRLRAEYFFARSANFAGPKLGGIERVSSLEYWDLSRESGNARPQVTLFYDESSEVNDLASLVVGHYTGGNWENENGTAVGLPSGYITSDNWMTFSETTLATTNAAANPLPVELLDFSGQVIERSALLQWGTASETNNDYFVLERSYDGYDFETIATINGQGTSQEVNTYQVFDEQLRRGENFYRLTQVDFDGESEELGTVRMVYAAGEERLSAQIFPNPSTAAGLAMTIMSIDWQTPVQIRLLDLSGSPVFTSVISPDVLGALYRPTLDLPDGVYLMELLQGSARYQAKLIIRN
ncbi:MAG: T9SS type A sorting domain-containing protein, partial [Bacteroidota bacterium]